MALNQLTIVIGILAAQIVNWRIADPVPHRGDGRDDPPVVERAVRVALDVHGGRGPGGGVLLCRAGGPGEPAMARCCAGGARRRGGFSTGSGGEPVEQIEKGLV